MATLGTSYRVIYASKNYRSGLTDIFAQASKPNGAVVGNFPLTELVGSLFAGIYYFDLSTSSSDPVGNWVVVVYSPTELFKEFTTVRFDDLLTTARFLGLK